MGCRRKTQNEVKMQIESKFSNIELISLYKTSNENHTFRCKDCGHIWQQIIYNLSGCPNCKVNKRYETLSNDDYLLRLRQKGIVSIIPVEGYIASRTNIKHKCLKCEYEWSVKPNNILTGYGCPFCAGQAVVQGVNDLWTAEPSIASMLLNLKDGYQYSRRSNRKLDWVCPDCKSVIHNRIINNVVSQGLKCPRCSDGNSIPNKFMTNILDSLNIEFETEKTFEWSKNRRYDFYIPALNCLIEMNGGQHYKLGFEYVGGRTLLEEIENDKLKYKLAYQNAITNYVVINCKSSELNWMKENILNSSLATILDIKNTKWDECYKSSLNSNIVKASELWDDGNSVQQIMQILHISNTTVCDYLRKANLIGLCKYLGFNERLKEVICLNTNEIFNSIKEAQEKYNVCHVGDCCRGIRLYAGIHPLTGEKLVWEFINNKTRGADCYSH